MPLVGGPLENQSGAAAMELRLMETCISSCGVARRTTPVAGSVQGRCHVMMLSPASLPPEPFFVYCRKHQTIDGFLSVLSRGSRSHATQRPNLAPNICCFMHPRGMVAFWGALSEYMSRTVLVTDAWAPALHRAGLMEGRGVGCCINNGLVFVDESVQVVTPTSDVTSVGQSASLAGLMKAQPAQQPRSWMVLDEQEDC